MMERGFEFLVDKTLHRFVEPICQKTLFPAIRWVHNHVTIDPLESYNEYRQACMAVYEQQVNRAYMAVTKSFKETVDSFYSSRRLGHVRPLEISIDDSPYREFINSIDKCMKYDRYIWSSAFLPYEKKYEIPSHLKLPYLKTENGLKFNDRVFSLETTIARLFTGNPYNKVPYPELDEYIKLILKTREERKKIFDGFESNPDKTLAELGVDEYELQFEGKSIYHIAKGKKISALDETTVNNLLRHPKYVMGVKKTKDFIPEHGYLIPPNYSPKDFLFLVNKHLMNTESYDDTASYIHSHRDPDKDLYQKIETIKSQEDLWGFAIHPALNNLSEKSVPSDTLPKLEQLKLNNVAYSLYFRSNVYGNRKRFWEIKCEVLDLSEFDRSLFYEVLTHYIHENKERLDKTCQLNIDWMVNEIKRVYDLHGKKAPEIEPETRTRIQQVLKLTQKKSPNKELNVEKMHAAFDFAVNSLSCIQRDDTFSPSSAKNQKSTKDKSLHIRRHKKHLNRRKSIPQKERLFIVSSPKLAVDTKKFIREQAKTLTFTKTTYAFLDQLDQVHWLEYHPILKEIIESVETNTELGREYLKICKMVDYAVASLNCMQRKKIPHSTYVLRKLILEKCPEITADEAFTRQINPGIMKEIKLKEYGKYWIDQRSGEHGHAIVNLHIRVLSASNKAVGIAGTRGNTGAGKTSGLQNIPGTFDLDKIKWDLRKGTKVRNKQIHHEGAMVFDFYFQEMSKKMDFRYKIDLRHLDLEQLNTYVIKPARERECSVSIKDYDVPLITSLVRVLVREPREKDPCPPLGVIVDGYKEIRKNRQEIINCLITETLLNSYRLYDQGREIAFIENGKLTIYDTEAFAKCVRESTDEEIKETLDRVISKELIKEAVENKYIYVHQADRLNKWIGTTIAHAVNQQSEL